MAGTPAIRHLFSPAKVNLMLSITGLRADRFHDLVSLVAQLDFGDRLTLTADPQRGEDCLECPGHPELEGPDNLVLRAVAAFRQRAGGHLEAATGARHVHIVLGKAIPAGAGLGGGSSNAAVTLRALNDLAGCPLTASEMAGLASDLGSDCPLFLQPQPLVMRGRGERLEALPSAATTALSGRRLLVFKPSFSIGTGWAYGVMKAADGAMYEPTDVAETRLTRWLEDPADPARLPLFNSMEAAAATKFVAVPTLLQSLRADGIACLMSGSGSACFAFVDDGPALEALTARIRSDLGPQAFLQAARLR